MSRSPMVHGIETRSGAIFDFDRPRPESVRIEDIAYGLGNICRFAGQLKRFYSVAEHSVLVYDLLVDESPEVRLGGLLHDAHEAYLGDVPTPLKAYLGYRWHKLVEDTDEAIGIALHVDEGLFHHSAVKRADEAALEHEVHALKHHLAPHWDGLWPRPAPPGRGVFGHSPGAAAGLFLNAYQRAMADCREAVRRWMS